MMLSTARKEKVKERSDFEMQQRYEERARALMPKNRMGGSSDSVGGNKRVIERMCTRMCVQCARAGACALWMCMAATHACG